MYYKKLNTKKASIVLFSAIISLAIIPLNCFATTYENYMGVSSDAFAVTDQATDTPSQSPTNSTKEIIDSINSKHIILNTPGDYRLIGADSVDNSNPQNENEIIVNPENTISIVGPGKYNIVLDNVNIAMNEIQERYSLPCPFMVIGGAQLNLTLEGANTLNNTMEDGYGLFINNISKLTITKSSDGSTLDIRDDEGIQGGHSLVIKGGKIKAHCINLSFGGVLTIEGGNIEASQIHADNMIVNGGIIHAEETLGRTISINGGTITSNKISGNINMTNGELITHNLNYKLCNNHYIRNLEKIFGTLNNNGELVSNSTEQTHQNNRIIKYFTKITPPPIFSITSPDRYFYISGGSINGIGLTTDSNDDYALKDGNNFPSESSRNNYRDTLILFSK